MLSLKLLSDIQCCLRCCLRLSGETLRHLYSLESKREEMLNALDSQLGDQNDSIKMFHRTEDDINCPLCLNILKDHNLKNCVEKVTQKMKDENYDSETFALNSMIPNSVKIRQHSLMLFALENVGSSLPTNLLTVKDAFKFSLISTLEENIKKKWDSQSLLRITAVMNYKDEEKEILSIPSEKNKTISRKRKRDSRPSAPTSSSLQASLDKLTSVELMKEHYPCPPNVPIESIYLKEISCFQESIFVGGRYNKYSRDLSQTPWFIDGVRKTETSLQELSCQKIQEFFAADDIKFISAGREDVDVRMLGSGRPFAVELINPRRTTASIDDMNQLQLSINNATDLIAVNKLQIVSKSDLTLLKEGEEQKIKFYSALIYAKSEISDDKLTKLEKIKDLVLAQKTPIRVLHRRPLAVRNKTVHTMSTKRIDESHFRLFLSTQAGTYIKEFVHGDFRRTKPSLGTLLETETDILELDVEEIQLDWPPVSEDSITDETQMV